MAQHDEEKLPQFHDAASLFDDIGKSYQDAFRDVPGQHRSLKWLLDRLRSEGGRKKILDVGSGTGRPVAETLATAGHDVKGIDLSSNMVSIAREQVPAATFEVANAIKYEPGMQFDVVTSYFAFLDSVSRPQIKEILGRIASWVKPGGYFIYATVPGDQNEERGPWMGRMITLTTYPVEDYLEILKGSGLEILHSEEDKFQPHAKTWTEDQLFVYARKK